MTSSGRIKLEGSGGSGELEIEIPPGNYRARLSGFDFEPAKNWSYDDPGHPADHYASSCGRRTPQSHQLS